MSYFFFLAKIWKLREIQNFQPNFGKLSTRILKTFKSNFENLQPELENFQLEFENFQLEFWKLSTQNLNFQIKLFKSFDLNFKYFWFNFWKLDSDLKSFKWRLKNFQLKI